MDQRAFQSPEADLSLKTQTSRSLSWWFEIMIGVPLLLEAGVLLATGMMERFLYLFIQSLLGVILVWPVSVPLLILLYLGWSNCLKREEMQSLRLLWLAPLIILPITMLCWGVLFYNPDYYSGNYERWHLLFLELIFFAFNFLAILAIFLNRGRQSFVAPFSLLSILVNHFCAFVFGSLVSGEWL